MAEQTDRDGTGNQETESGEYVSFYPDRRRFTRTLMDRRGFLGHALLFSGGAALAACSGPGGGSSNEFMSAPGAGESAETIDLENVQMEMREVMLGGRRMEFGSEIIQRLPGMPRWSPDGGTSLWRVGDLTYLMMPARRETYLSVIESSGSVRQAEQVFGPSLEHGNIGFEGYAGIMSVFPRGDELFGVCHYEYWQAPNVSSNFTARVGLVKSRNNGRDWERVDTIITGMNEVAPNIGHNASGAGQPTAMVLEDQGVVRVCYIDWNLGRIPDQLHMAEAPLDQIEDPSVWRKWHNGSFGSLALGGESTPVLGPSTDEGIVDYAALPNITQREGLGPIVCFETNSGFCVATSEDGGTRWINVSQISQFPQPQFPVNAGDVWFSYPSLLWGHSDSDWDGFLIYSKGVRDRVDHTIHLRPVRLR